MVQVSKAEYERLKAAEAQRNDLAQALMRLSAAVDAFHLSDGVVRELVLHGLVERLTAAQREAARVLDSVAAGV